MPRQISANEDSLRLDVFYRNGRQRLVTNKVMMPYIYVLFYEKINPQLRPNEDAAYIFTNDDLLPAADSGYTIKRFKHYMVVSGMGTVNAP